MSMWWSVGRIGDAAMAAALLAVTMALGAPRAQAEERAVKNADDLQVVVSESPEIRRKGGTVKLPKLEIEANQILTFVNAGTQSAAIVSIKLLVVDGPPDADCVNWSGVTMGAQFYPYDFEPLVLRPGEIAVRKVRLRRTDTGALPVFEPMFNSDQQQLPNAQWRVINCMSFDIVVPGRQVTKAIATGENMFNKTGGASMPIDNKFEVLVRSTTDAAPPASAPAPAPAKSP
jgi:hypothetical protein